MHRTPKSAGRGSPPDGRRRRTAAEGPRPDPLERVLALQRAAGNSATAALLRRSEVTSGSAAALKLAIGTDVPIEVVSVAWQLTNAGALDDKGIAALRGMALMADRSVDDNERLFIAALMDPANAKAWHADPQGLGFGHTLEFPVASITAANRAKVQNFDRGTTPPTQEPDPAGGTKAVALDDQIVALAGPFAAVARDAIAIADEAKVPHEAVYFAMLNGASDSTPGDRAFAGAVYAIARRERLSVAGDILAGRIKVDEVTRASLPKNAEGMYVPSAGGSGRKGDTLYLPSDIQFSVAGQGLVVHELTHAEQDAAAAAKPEDAPVVEAESGAFRAEAAFFLDAIAKRSGPARQRAVAEIAKTVRLPTMLCAVLAATEVLGNTTALTALRELHTEVLVNGYPATALAFKKADFDAMLAGLASEDTYSETMTRLEKRIEAAIKSDYAGIAPARDDGFRGESLLDANAPPASGVRRQPKDEKVEDKAPPVDEIELIVGGDISVEFAKRAKALAGKPIGKAAELELHDLALKGDDTVSDAERLLIAALSDPANAKRVAALKVEETATVRLSFPREKATRDKVHAVADLRRPSLAADVTKARDAATKAGAGVDPAKTDAAAAKAEKAAETQILALAGSAKGRAKDVIAFAKERKVSPGAVLDAMIAAGSDSTAGDMVAAGAVFAIAQAAAHPLAADVRAGKIKVDEKAKLSFDVSGFEARALYQPAAEDLRRVHGPDRLKGDTMYLSSAFDVRNAADRGTVIHELHHAGDDKRGPATGALQQAKTLDLELAAYTVGARYTLEEIARQPAGKPRTKAVADVADTWDSRHTIAAVLASRTAARSAPPKWVEVAASPLRGVVREVYGALKAKDKAAIEANIGPLDSNMAAKLDELVETVKGEITRGGAVDPRDVTPLDSQSGESIVDTIDRRPAPPARKR